jgi:hypothetical protein
MNLKSVVAIAAIKAAAKQLGINVTAKQLPILIAIEVGHFLTEIIVDGNAYVKDGVGAEDGFVYQFLKTLTDNPVLADNAVTAFYKVLAENPSVSETQVFDFYKNLAENPTVADAYASSFAKPVSENPNATDSNFYALGKPLADAAAIVDTDFKAVAKFFTENPAMADTNILSFFKNLSENPNFTDTINTLALTKALTDGVNATDDLDAAASILDDQEMQFVKNTTNTAAITDAFARVVAFTRSFSETPAITDVNILGVGKTVSENPAFSDTNYVNFGKLLSEQPNFTDVLALQVTLSPFTEAPGVTDSADVVPNKVFLETPSLTDAGSLRSQGYCDFTFFAEDFVGASRNF